MIFDDIWYIFDISLNTNNSYFEWKAINVFFRTKHILDDSDLEMSTNLRVTDSFKNR